ncbi:D-alanyl-D-alanine carboxypeptidase family protein [Oceanobacillus halophilus]|uniref:Carboxypeptidase n=1 Tax=Oceanobacillus halophilus TaxID=930130 RepID=A0A495A292_9BACI|nr:D-alanyl-D-alanine carboxypeptidase family protein [Oceanobacillus halophilus]RKQ33202.1 carboxypeptidase [Oceanobacillus halophilus]
MFNKKVMQVMFFIAILFLISACSFDDLGNNGKNKETDQKNEAIDEEIGNSHETDVDKEKGDSITAPRTLLQKKDQGKSVTQLQEALNQIGYDIDTNGIFSELTTWAITDFQLQHEDLMDIGIYNKETEKVINQYIEKNETIEAGKGLPFLEETVSTDSGAQIIANPYDQLSIVNKEYALPNDYIPEDLVIPNVRFPFTEELPKKQMREIAADALEEMFAAADEEGLELYAQSGYRSYERQEVIFAANVDVHGEKEANNFSARPGESEHQTGLTMDISSPDVGFKLIEEFGDTEEGKWVQEHAADYGFIIRYPKGKEEITQYQYEPWHLRYVGKKAAKEMMEQEMTLEEYLID